MAKPRSPQAPKKGWIYDIDPDEIWIKCRLGHYHRYQNDPGGKVECQEEGCTCEVNTSQVMRGYHPYIVVNSEEYAQQSHTQVFIAVPRTSQDTFSGLPTSYPIRPSTENGLDKPGYALIHQVTAIDARCFKDNTGKWLQRRGKLKPEDLEAINERLRFLFDLPQTPDDDWFIKNATPELLAKVYSHIKPEERNEALETLIEMEFEK